MKASHQSLCLPTFTEQIDTALARGAADAASRARAVAPPRSLPTPARTGAGARSLRIVGILAFCQSLLFLLLWLFLCAWAGAATKPVADFAPQLQASNYQPNQARDPFLPATMKTGEVKVATAAPLSFVLQGILYDAHNPAAIVNGQLVTLDKPATIVVGETTVAVTAVEITRERVVLASAGQRFALRLGSPVAAAAAAKH